MILSKILKTGALISLLSLMVSSGVTAEEAPATADSAKTGAAAGEQESKDRNSFTIRRVGALPTDPWDSAWDTIEPDPIALPITGQAAIQPRLFISSVKEMKITAAHNDTQVAFLIEYADTSEDIDYNGTTDAAAIMFPVEPLPLRAHIYMGEPMLQVEGTYVNIWHWKAIDNKAVDMKGEGIVGPPTPHESQDVQGKGVWKDGKWRILFTRNMTTTDTHDSKFVPTQFANVSFATWDAKSNETKSMHGTSSWYYVVPEAAPDKSIYIYGLIGFVIAGVLEFAFVKTIKKKRINS